MFPWRPAVLSETIRSFPYTVHLPCQHRPAAEQTGHHPENSPYPPVNTFRQQDSGSQNAENKTSAGQYPADQNIPPGKQSRRKQDTQDSKIPTNKPPEQIVPGYPQISILINRNAKGVRCQTVRKPPVHIHGHTSAEISAEKPEY